jgi:hypothetical protein
MERASCNHHGDFLPSSSLPHREKQADASCPNSVAADVMPEHIFDF